MVRRWWLEDDAHNRQSHFETIRVNKVTLVALMWTVWFLCESGDSYVWDWRLSYNFYVSHYNDHLTYDSMTFELKKLTTNCGKPWRCWRLITSARWCRNIILTVLSFLCSLFAQCPLELLRSSRWRWKKDWSKSNNSNNLFKPTLIR